MQKNNINSEDNMHLRKMKPALIFAVLSVCAAIAMFVIGHMSAQTSTSQRKPSAVDYPAFQAMTDEAAAHREQRLITLEDFLEMGAATDTIILDTRSKSAFEEGHIKGAIHLNFSDFTDDKLGEIISDFDTRILIYCNNNFSNDVSPVPKKMVSLALNIPTFINLYGYGYTNIYELGEEISLDDLNDNWVTKSNH